MDRTPASAHGIIRHRLLVNALVDPDEAASRLPPPLRPHDTGLGTVVGCCLLDVAQLRAAGLPRWAGVSMRAAAHRISIELPDGTVGVYVPARHTQSRLATAMGGRVFPGVHERAVVSAAADARALRWRVEPPNGEFALAVEASVVGSRPGVDPVAAACLGATLGLSPGHRHELEALRMVADPIDAQRVQIVRLRSSFLAGFCSARPAPSFVMIDVPVTWAPAPVPLPATTTA